jgi:H/ACA ribonucleoprotein complex subunit 4
MNKINLDEKSEKPREEQKDWLSEIKKKKTMRELLEFGIINLDKPDGPTSFQAAEIVGKMLEARKFSHFGTLDPAVTGVLPVAINRACKLSTWMMKKNKTYVGVMKMHKKISRKKLEEEMKRFVGKIMQLPPIKSRVKREVREREIFSWDIIEIKDKDVLFKTEVEAGTYIRKLISDLGEKIGGAHMTELRRTNAGLFSEDDKNFVNLYQLEEAWREYKEGREEKLREIIIPGEIIGKVLPIIFVEGDIKQLLTGKPIYKEEMKDVPKLFCLFMENRFVGVYRRVLETDIIARAEWVLN